jgi:hypothetical protein
MDVYERFTNPAFTMEKTDFDNVPDVFLEIAGHRGDGRAEDVEAHAERLLLALRLISDLPEAIHSFWTVDSNPFPAIVPPRYVLHETLLPLAKPENPYVITPEIAARAQELWPQLELRIADPRLSLAVRRFDDSYYRKRPDDRLIDLWIALETLFLQTDEGELRFRAALMIARYVGASQEARLKIFKDVKASYDLRSKLVHGAVKPRDKLAELVDRTGEILRLALLRCLPSHKPPAIDEILERLLT